jgi:hypothetical protein
MSVPELTDNCYFWLIAYTEAAGGKVSATTRPSAQPLYLITRPQLDAGILGGLLGKTAGATYMKIQRTKKKLADEGFVFPAGGTSAIVATGTGDGEDVPKTPKKKAPRKAATESAKKRKATLEENEYDEGASEDVKSNELKKIKLSVKKEAGDDDGEEGKA